jgi:hypothetical protein
MSATTFTRTRMPFELWMTGKDPVAIIERSRELGWTPPEHEAFSVEVDGETVDPGSSFGDYRAMAKQSVDMYYGYLPGAILCDVQHGRATVGKPAVDVDIGKLVEQLATVPFETAAFGSIYQHEASNSAQVGFSASPIEGARNAWAFAWRGAGHERLLSQRWLAQGPWKLWRGPSDTMLLQLHALDVDAQTANEQAAAAWRFFGYSNERLLIPRGYKARLELGGDYDAATQTMRVRVDGPPTNDEQRMLAWEHAVARKLRRDSPQPIRSVAFVFADEELARAELPRLWRMEHEVWVERDGKQIRLDIDYAPPDMTPAWTRSAKLELGDIELGDFVRTGTGDAVHRATSKIDGSALLVTVTNGHAEVLRKDAYDLPVVGIAALAWIGSVEGKPFADALVERVPLHAHPASDHGVVAAKPLAALGGELARIVLAAAELGITIDGIRPELIYIDDEARFVVLAPRGPRFVGSARTFATGPRSYPVPYVGREAIAQGRPASTATDVFALCVSLFAIGTGRHPFGDDLPEIIRGIMSGEHAPWPDASALGKLVVSGLAANPDDRPTPQQLIGGFDAAAT